MIYFFCDIDLPNYVDTPSAYKYLHGRHSSTGYYYWMLKNGGHDVNITSNPKELQNASVVIFHYDNKDVIKNLNCKKIQVVTDRPYVEGCDRYIAANTSIVSPTFDADVIERYGIENTMNTWNTEKDKWSFIHYPPTFGIKKCKAQFPPCNFKYVGRESTMIPELMEKSYISKCADHGINLHFDFVNDGNDGTEDVYFCVRKASASSKVSGLENNAGKHGHRTANRLYQTWFMETPGIFNVSPEMNSIITSELDFLPANNSDEFFEQALRLKTDESLFYSMIENGKAKLANPYSNINIVVDQWLEVLAQI